MNSELPSLPYVVCRQFCLVLFDSLSWLKCMGQIKLLQKEVSHQLRTESRGQKQCWYKSRAFFFLFSSDFCTQLLIEKLYLQKARKCIQLKGTNRGALSHNSSFRGIIWNQVNKVCSQFTTKMKPEQNLSPSPQYVDRTLHEHFFKAAPPAFKLPTSRNLSKARGGEIFLQHHNRFLLQRVLHRFCSWKRLTSWCMFSEVF